LVKRQKLLTVTSLLLTIGPGKRAKLPAPRATFGQQQYARRQSTPATRTHWATRAVCVPKSPSYFLEVLNSSNRPSEAWKRQRSRSWCFSAAVIGWSPWAISKFWRMTPGESIAADGHGQRKAHGISQRLGRRDHALLHQVATSAHAFHSQRRHPAPDHFGKHWLFEAMPRRFNSGSTFCSKLRKLPSNAFRGTCTASNGKPVASIFKWISGALCPVKPTKRTLPCFLAAPKLRRRLLFV
jgi:hypothetical protein